MVSHPRSSSDRHANGRSGAGSGHGKAERTPGTPRKDGGAGKDKAVQDPGLKDYVSVRPKRRDAELLIYGIASRGMFRQGSFWISLQSVQLGNRRSSSCQADKVRRSSQERVADDRGRGADPILSSAELTYVTQAEIDLLKNLNVSD